MPKPWPRPWRPRENILSSEDARRASLKSKNCEVDVTLLREAFERSGLSMAEVARRLNWSKPDAYRVGRALGIYTRHSTGPSKKQEFMSYEHALELARALNLDPHDVDL
jgi:hypothetical protein